MWSPQTTWQDIQEVVWSLEQVIDFDLVDTEIELCYVLALATVLANDYEVTVVTEDDVVKPDIVSTVRAAELVGLPAVDLRVFGSATGVDIYFV